MRKYMILVVLILFCLSCDKNSTGIDSSQPGVKVIVNDENNNPLASVDCHYLFYLSDQSVVRNQNISFSLNENDTASLYLTHPLLTDPIILFQDKILLRGNYSFIINSSKFRLTNGIYHYELILKNKTITGNLPFVYDNIDTLISYSPLIQSDNSGEIFLPYTIFHAGANFGSPDRPRVVSDSIKIVLYKEGYSLLTRSVQLDPDKTITLNCVLNNN